MGEVLDGTLILGLSSWLKLDSLIFCSQSDLSCSSLIRLGMALADPEVITYMNRVKYPYNVNLLTQSKALEMLASTDKRENWVREILRERTKLKNRLENIEYVRHIFPSDANFLLVRVENPDGLYNYLTGKGVIVRNRSRLTHCQGCLRITVGTPEENSRLIELMKSYPR